MQIACSSWSLHKEIPRNLPLLSFPAWCGSQGITAIEIVDNQLPSMERKYLTDLQRACSEANVSIACLAISNDFTIPDADQLFAQVERTRFLLYDVAMPMNIPVVRVRLGMSDTSKEGDQRALTTFRGLVPDMEATGIAMALENHARVTTTADQTAAIIAGVNSELFGSCVDFGNLPVDRRYDAVMTLAGFAKHVHANSYAFDANGEETTIDYKRTLAYLTENGYNGVIAIEYEGTDDPYQGVIKTKGLIEKYWYQPWTEPVRKAA